MKRIATKIQSIVDELEQSLATPGERDEFTVEEMDDFVPPEGDVLEVEEGLLDATEEPPSQPQPEAEGHEADKFLDLEDVRLLALTFSEKYGYDENAKDIPTPSDELKEKLKQSLDSVYQYTIERGRASRKVRYKDRYADKYNAKLEKEKAVVDSSLNDLEAQHAAEYYRKLDSINRRDNIDLWNKANGIKEEEEVDED